MPWYRRCSAMKTAHTTTKEARMKAVTTIATVTFTAVLFSMFPEIVR